MDFVILFTIFTGLEEEERLRKQAAQATYRSTDKGKAKMARNNARRRNKTQFKRVLKELLKTTR